MHLFGVYQLAVARKRSLEDVEPSLVCTSSMSGLPQHLGVELAAYELEHPTGREQDPAAALLRQVYHLNEDAVGWVLHLDPPLFGRRRLYLFGFDVLRSAPSSKLVFIWDRPVAAASENGLEMCRDRFSVHLYERLYSSTGVELVAYEPEYRFLQEGVLHLRCSPSMRLRLPRYLMLYLHSGGCTYLDYPVALRICDGAFACFLRDRIASERG